MLDVRSLEEDGNRRRHHAATGLALAVASDSSEPEAMLTGMLIAAVGATLAVGGLLGMASMHDDDARAAARREKLGRAPIDSDEAERRDYAWKLTKRASAAARLGDCPMVIDLGRELYGFDREFHDTVFARDIAIRRCLWPSET